MEKQLKLISKEFSRIKPRLQKNKTVPEIFNKQWGENFISDYLAYVLDPNLNGVGYVFINELASLIEKETVICSDKSEVIINREKVLDDGRIDFLIEIDKEIIIAIENKTISKEIGGQTTYYYNRIIEKYPKKDYKHYFIFLNPNGEKAECNEFITITYSDIFNK